jgi:hypothetical protein
MHLKALGRVFLPFFVFFHFVDGFLFSWWEYCAVMGRGCLVFFSCEKLKWRLLAVTPKMGDGLCDF